MAACDCSCIFCDAALADLEELAVHLIVVHPRAQVQIEKEQCAFKLYKHTGHFRVRCICGQRFTCNAVHDRIAPFFRQWAIKTAEIDSFVAHLRKVGGMAAHLQALRDDAIFAKIAKAVSEQPRNLDAALRQGWADAMETTVPSLPRLVEHLLDEMLLDSIRDDDLQLLSEPKGQKHG